MIKKEFPGIFYFLILIPAIYANCRQTIIYTPFRENGFYLPAPDTIYQTDTVYQYVIVYDTLYYDDSPQETDTTTISDTIVEQTDGAVIIRNSLKMNLKQKKTVYLNQELQFIGNPVREFEEIPRQGNEKKDAPFTPVEKSGQKSKKRLREKDVEPDDDKKPISHEPITYFLRDTIFFFDTIITREMVFDTVFFTNSSTNADTTVTRYTEFEKMGKLVMAIETVKYTVKKRESIFVEKNTKSVYKPPPSHSTVSSSRKGSKTSTHNLNHKSKHRRKDTAYEGREFPDKKVDYSAFVNGSFSVFKPEINFSNENNLYDGYADYLNHNTNQKTSPGAGLSYSYFRNNKGFELGLGLSRYRFQFDHTFDEASIDTSYFWEYFEKSIYEYDTTWFLNLDTLLQTGDTLFVPGVDSTLIQVTDSIQKPDFDTTFVKKYANYNYSYSYLEIPLTGRFLLFDGKISGQLALGIVPAFLVSKSGKMPLNETGTIVGATEIAYDNGFSLSGYGAFTLTFKLNENSAIFLEPYIRRNIYSTMKNEYFKVRHNSFGVRFGVSYTLFSTKNIKFR